jgi:hypothetical protein
LDGGPLLFVHVRNDAAPLDRLVQPTASIVDKYGVTYVVREEDADRHGLVGDFRCRRLELGVETPLAGIGFLAVILTALAAAGIAVNPFAGFHRDTLFVPVALADDAVAVLRRLKEEARSRLRR